VQACVRPSFCMHVGLVRTRSRQWSRVNDATIRAQERKCATNILTKLTGWESKLYIFGDNHGRDIESRQLPKITDKAKITVITVMVNSWFTYIPSDGILTTDWAIWYVSKFGSVILNQFQLLFWIFVVNQKFVSWNVFHAARPAHLCDFRCYSLIVYLQRLANFSHANPQKSYIMWADSTTRIVAVYTLTFHVSQNTMTLWPYDIIKLLFLIQNSTRNLI